MTGKKLGKRPLEAEECKAILTKCKKKKQKRGRIKVISAAPFCFLLYICFGVTWHHLSSTCTTPSLGKIYSSPAQYSWYLCEEPMQLVSSDLPTSVSFFFFSPSSINTTNSQHFGKMVLSEKCKCNECFLKWVMGSFSPWFVGQFHAGSWAALQSALALWAVAWSLN